MVIIKVLEAKNPVWANAERTSVVLDVNFEHLNEEWVSFHATDDDPEPHGRLILDQAKMGAYGPIGPYVDNE